MSEELSSAGQVTPQQLQQAAQEGFKSVLNLRSPHEQGFLNDEQQQALSAGLNYVNVALNPSESNQELVEKAIWVIENLPKPVLIHCAAGARATAIALIATASQQKLTPEEIKLKAEELGLNLEQPHLKQFIQQAE
nr:MULTISPECIES: sulfur transferase domain-containing protein [Nostocales]